MQNTDLAQSSCLELKQTSFRLRFLSSGEGKPLGARLFAGRHDKRPCRLREACLRAVLSETHDERPQELRARERAVLSDRQYKPAEIKLLPMAGMYSAAKDGLAGRARNALDPAEITSILRLAKRQKDQP